MDKLHADEAFGNGQEPLAVEVAWFHCMTATKPTVRRLDEVLDAIQNGKWRADIERLREIRARDVTDYHREKIKLPSFYPSGTASTPKMMRTHNGILQVDLDGLEESLYIYRDLIMADPHAAAVFVSPGGEGLKVLFRLAPFEEPLNKEEHKLAVAAVMAYVQHSYGVTPDRSCSNVNRHCLVSYDPELFRNPNAVAFPWRTQASVCEGGERAGSSPKTLILQDSNPAELQNYHTTPHSPQADIRGANSFRSIHRESFTSSATLKMGATNQMQPHAPSFAFVTTLKKVATNQMWGVASRSLRSHLRRLQSSNPSGGKPTACGQG